MPHQIPRGRYIIYTVNCLKNMAEYDMKGFFLEQAQGLRASAPPPPPLPQIKFFSKCGKRSQPGLHSQTRNIYSYLFEGQALPITHYPSLKI